MKNYLIASAVLLSLGHSIFAQEGETIRDPLSPQEANQPVYGRTRNPALEKPQAPLVPKALDADLVNIRMRAANTALSQVRDIFGGAQQPLIISANAKDPESIANTAEDLQVMARLLDKAVSRAMGQAQVRYMGISIPGLTAGQSPQSFYIDDYGAMFLMTVQFPLMPHGGAESDATKKDSDSSWEQAKRELRGTPLPPTENRTAEYSAEKVELLKKELTTELKNATNIRGLKPGDMITVVVTGEEGMNGLGRTASTWKPRRTADQNNPFNVDRPPRQATMTLRVKKSDMENFANGKMQLEDFQKKVTAAIY